MRVDKIFKNRYSKKLKINIYIIKLTRLQRSFGHGVLFVSGEFEYNLPNSTSKGGFGCFCEVICLFLCYKIAGEKEEEKNDNYPGLSRPCGIWGRRCDSNVHAWRGIAPRRRGPNN